MTPITTYIGASIRLFADDTSLYIIVDLPDQVAIIINTDLKTIFACQLYSLDRLRYLPANLDNLTSNDLLFGCENQSDEFKESLFLKVQEF